MVLHKNSIATTMLVLFYFCALTNKISVLNYISIMFLFFAIMLLWKEKIIYYNAFYFCTIIFALLNVTFMLGTFVNIVYIDNLNESVFHNIALWFFNYLILVLVLFKLEYFYLRKLILSISLLSIFVSIGAIIYSHYFDSSYFYYGLNRFSLLSKNPNQLAMGLLSTIVSISVIASNERNLSYLKIFVIMVLLYLSIITRSQAVWLAFGMLAVIFLPLYIYTKKHTKRYLDLNRAIFVLLSIFIFVSAVIVFLNKKEITHYLFGGLGTSESKVRYLLWSTGFFGTLDASPLFGLGYGSVIDLNSLTITGSFEAHSTYIDIFINGGFIGLLVFFYPFMYLLIRCLKKRLLIQLLGLIVILIFISLHLMYRNPFLYLSLFIIYVSIRQKEQCVE